MDDAWDDVQAELCDVIFTAMVALATLTPDVREVFHAHLARVADRSLRSPDHLAAAQAQAQAAAENLPPELPLR